MAELLISNGNYAGTVFLLAQDPTVVGRSDECQVVLSDPWISSRHCLIERRGDELWIVDLGSRNGTYVDDRRIHEALLQEGGRVLLGRTAGVVRQVKSPGGGRQVPEEATAVRFLSDIERRVSEQGEAATTAEAVRRQLGVLHAIGKALADAPAMDESLSRILRAVAEAVRAERSTLLLIDEKGAMAPRVNLPPDLPPRLSTSILAAAMRTRAGLLVVDAQVDERFSKSQSVFFEGIRSCLCVPIWAESRTLGALVLDRGVADPFTDDDLELVTVVAYQVALAIERVRLIEHARLADTQRRKLLRHFSPDIANAILTQEGADDPLSVSVREEVTVLFSDIKGFTHLTERLPPIELALLLREYFHEMTISLFEERGTLDKFMGDGLMAIFGAPVADSDGALRAVRCARRMMERLASLNGRLAPDRQLNIRIGINTGRVVAGSFGSPDRLEFTVLGDTVNVASRLESIAEAGAILVGRTTFDRTSSRFSYRSLGQRAVKGRVAPVEVYELLGPLQT